MNYYHSDQLGSVRALTDSNGAVQRSYDYDPYSNLAASSRSVMNPFMYSGQYPDQESNLYYLRARYYDLSTGQFIAKDPFSSATRQPYQYAKDSPLNRIDPSGLRGVDSATASQPS